MDGFFVDKADKTYFHVYVSDKMISKVVAYVHFFYFSVLVFHFNENVFKEVIVMGLHLHIRDSVNSCCGIYREIDSQ